MPGIPDLYAILQVDAAADSLAVRSAYRRLARQNHPDRGGSSKQMARLNAAYAILRDSSMRAGYDAVCRQLAAEGQSSPQGAETTYRATPGPRVAGGAAQGPTIAAEGPLARARARAAAAGEGGHGFGSGAGRAAGQDWLNGAAAGSAESGWRAGAAFGGFGAQRSGAHAGRALDFGRYEGWTIAQVARSDPDFLEWLERMPVGRQYRTEIDACLRDVGRRPGADASPSRSVATFAKAAQNGRGGRMPRFAVLHRG